jgi:uncharacterized membrane protein (UPF0127 family)
MQTDGPVVSALGLPRRLARTVHRVRDDAAAHRQSGVAEMVAAKARWPVRAVESASGHPGAVAWMRSLRYKLDLAIAVAKIRIHNVLPGIEERPGELSGLEVWVANTMCSRLLGLLGRPPLTSHQAMLLRRCSLVHTFGMRYSLDLVFMRRDGRVLDVVNALRPNRICGHWRAHCVLKLAPGVALLSGIEPGMRLPIEALGRSVDEGAAPRKPSCVAA